MVTAAPFDAAEYLDSPEVITAYLTDVFESDDPALIAKAIGNVARAQGMTDAIEKIGPLSADATLELTTVLKVLNALGITLVAQTRAA